ncbi:MAG: KAP family P-loop NTPase fold protein [Luteolibacter sp.]
MPISSPKSLNFETHDRLGLKPFCERLETYLLVEHDYVDDSLVVALNGGFGTGKSTFLRMWESDLKARRADGKFVPMPLSLNAWESDYCGDPLMAILAALTEAVDAWDEAISDEDKEALKEAIKDVGWFVTGLANEFAAKWTGINVMAAGEVADKKKEDRIEKIPDFVELYQNRTAALRTLKEKLNIVFGGEEPKVFVFVDELDRCRPDYAVSYLETIKHVFDVRGMVFVLAIDREHLASSARALFGQDLDFGEYFRKFCHRVIDLPKPDESGARELVAEYAKKYLDIEGKRICGINLRDRAKNVVELAMGLRMRPRQLQEAYRIVGHVATVEDPDQRGQIDWCVGAMSICLSFLRVSHHDVYLKIKGGVMSHEDVGQFLISIVGKKRAEWWFCIYLTGLDREIVVTLDRQDVLIKVGFVGKGVNFDQNVYFGQFSQGWGWIEESNLSDIFRRIETVDKF